MAFEYIPDAVEGSAPGLEIRQRLGRLVASEGGESAVSVALTTLSNKRLEGIPVAQKIGEGQFRYFDSRGEEVTKQQAMTIADGVVYYQQAVDSSYFRLRQVGTFVSTDNARTILSGSRPGSDVGDMRAFDGHEEHLQRIQEEHEEIQQSRGNAGLRLCLLALPLFVAISALSAVASHAVAISALSAVASHAVIPSSSGQNAAGLAHTGNRWETRYADGGSPLSPEIASLLKADELGRDEILSRALLDMPQPAKCDVSSVEKRKRQAASEIDRILASRKETDILGAVPLSRQQKEFQRIALLLHPDKGLVSTHDQRGFDALRLALAARRRCIALASR